MAEDTAPDITALTVQLLSAFVSNNTVPSESLSDLIKSTRAALTDDVSAGTNSRQQDAQPDHVPAVSIRKSLASDEHIISLIDGKSYKTLKRHLASHGLTPEQYRERYKLPKTYPLVARSYSQARRAVAERLGLGRKPIAKSEPTASAASVSPAPQNAKAKEATGKSASKTEPKKAGRAKAPPASATASAKSTPSAQSSASGKTVSAKAPRKRLSIASPKDAAAPAATSRAPAAQSQQKTKVALKKPEAPRKAKAASKPKALKGDTGPANAAKGNGEALKATPATE